MTLLAVDWLSKSNGDPCYVDRDAPRFFLVVPRFKSSRHVLTRKLILGQNQNFYRMKNLMYIVWPQGIQRESHDKKLPVSDGLGLRESRPFRKHSRRKVIPLS